MSSEAAAITVSSLSKCYQIYSQPHHRLMQMVTGQKRQYFREFWALKDVSFSANRGETIGIIGPNGSGKSTLLQIITGTLASTAGDVEVKGKISALLELGAGFNPDFSGRENIYLNGAVLGLSREEVEAHFDAIVEFSGIGDFIDQPVKTYSSGMYVRLGFAVSVGVNPDVLIVDEALSVGDIRFQRKCFQKLDQLRDNGTTVLFVSHSPEAIINHCNRALLLKKGRVEEIGVPRDVVNKYVEYMVTTQSEDQPDNQRKIKSKQKPQPTFDIDDLCHLQPGYNSTEYRWGDGRAVIYNYRIGSSDSSKSATVVQGDTVEIEVDIHFTSGVESVVYGIDIRTVQGVQVFGTNTLHKGSEIGSKKEGEQVQVKFAFPLNLVAGDYFVSLGVATQLDDGAVEPLDRRYDLIHIAIQERLPAFGLAYLETTISEHEVEGVRL